MPRKPVKGVHYAKETLAGCEMVTLTPEGAGQPTKSVFFLHGGAYLFEPTPPHWAMVSDLVLKTGIRLHFFLYPKVPEHGFQTIQARTFQAYSQITDREAMPPILMGDSAGAGLALRVAQMRRDGAQALPSDLILLSPWLDCTASDPAALEIERHDPMLGIAGLRHAGKLFAQECDPADPKVSPLFGTADNLPQTHLFTCDRDILMPDAKAWADKLRALGETPYLHVQPGLFHDWMFTSVPEAKPVRTYLEKLLTSV